MTTHNAAVSSAQAPTVSAVDTERALARPLMLKVPNGLMPIKQKE